MRDLATIVTGQEQQQDGLIQGEAFDLQVYGQAAGARRRLEAELFPDEPAVADSTAAAVDVGPDLRLPELKVSRLTDDECWWLEGALQAAETCLKHGYAPWAARSHHVIWLALQRIAAGHGRPVDFEMAGNIYHYFWQAESAPWEPYVGTWHVEPWSVEFEHSGWPVDWCEAEPDEADSGYRTHG